MKYKLEKWAKKQKKSAGSVKQIKLDQLWSSPSVNIAFKMLI